MDCLNFGAYVRATRLAVQKYRVKSFYIHSLYISYLFLNSEINQYHTIKTILLSVNTSRSCYSLLNQAKTLGLVNSVSIGVYSLTPKGKEIVLYIDDQYKRIYNELEAGQSK